MILNYLRYERQILLLLRHDNKVLLKALFIVYFQFKKHSPVLLPESFTAEIAFSNSFLLRCSKESLQRLVR